MLNFDVYKQELESSAKIVNRFINSQEWDIIISTLKKGKHNMLVREDFDKLGNIYKELAELEKIYILDFMEYEKELWTIL